MTPPKKKKCFETVGHQNLEQFGRVLKKTNKKPPKKLSLGGLFNNIQIML